VSKAQKAGGKNKEAKRIFIGMYVLKILSSLRL